MSTFILHQSSASDGEMMKFILFAEGTVTVFKHTLTHSDIAGGREVKGAGIVPPLCVLQMLASGIEKSGLPKAGFLEGPRWRSSSLNVTTSMELREGLLEFFIVEKERIYAQ